MAATTMEKKQLERTRAIRLNAVVIAMGCFGVLSIAIYLTPDPRGFGTHEQLGLPPCISSAYLGFPCPLCGMTTAFALMAHARPVDAFHVQPAGALLFVAGVLVFSGALATATLGHTPSLILGLAQSRRIGALLFAVLAAAWVYKLIGLLR